ncbi:MAG: type II toxin-antitoxin system RelE/ParE family toxin [Saprospiraceae bacterium]|nr:type II toxin-antitoxin system RelE/ParE family toxin [Saprospiraceae bacterium]MCZ2338215.1 type II toxin-antitoxin system RelE/ParE family toxin [Chitinophagales bacterium]
MNHLKNVIEVELLEEAEQYFLALNEKIQVKFLRSFDKTVSGIKGPWFEKIQSKDGIFEFRERDQDKFYMLFAFWYGEGETKTLILCTHGLDKKTNKTPKSEIEKAIRIKKQYFKDKDIKR